MIEERKQKEAEFHNIIRKSEEEHGKEASNRKFYDITRKSNEFFYNYVIQNCLGKRALDYCCGDGKRTIFLAQHGAKSFGIDISEESIKKCKEIAEKEDLIKETNFSVMDAEKLEFEDNSFDLIICTGVLHHLDIQKAYPELARVLKSDGKIICCEPLVHNPFFQLYRRLTPNLRTKWEVEHILHKKDIQLAKKYFSKVETRFFHLATLLAIPFRYLPGFYFLLGILEKIDSAILQLPLVKWLAWQVAFTLSEPKK